VTNKTRIGLFAVDYNWQSTTRIKRRLDTFTLYPNEIEVRWIDRSGKHFDCIARAIHSEKLSIVSLESAPRICPSNLPLFEYNHLRLHGGLNYVTPFDKLQKVTELLS